MNESHELTLEKIMNQEWKCNHIIGFGAGLYIGSDQNARFFAKGNTNEIALPELMGLYEMICKEHNERLQAGAKWKKPPLPIATRIKQLLPKKKFVYPEMPGDHGEETKK